MSGHHSNSWKPIFHFNIDRNKEALALTSETNDHCIRELLVTEYNYVHALENIITCFAKPMEQFLKREESQIIFGYIKYFYNVHSTLLANLKKATPKQLSTPTDVPTSSRNLTISSCFLNVREKFLKYGEYCANLSKAQTLLDDLACRNDAISVQLERCQQEANDGRFKLRDLLSLPMQRILKYHLLIAQLIKHTSPIDAEYQGLENAHETLVDLGQYINEVKRDTEAMQIMEDIEQTIIGLNLPRDTKLIDYGRLITDGSIKVRLPLESKIDAKIKQKYVFVFDKVILMCKDSGLIGGYQYKEALVLDGYQLDVEPVNSCEILSRQASKDKHNYIFNLIRINDRAVYSFYPKSQETKNKWVDAIQRAMDNIRPAVCRNLNHKFQMHTFQKASSCDNCGKLLLGLYYQGYRCGVCFTGVHKRCIPSTRPCGPPLPPRHSTSRVSTKSNRCASEPSSPSRVRNDQIEVDAPLSERVDRYVNFVLDDWPWFCGRMDRERAQAILEEMPHETFLVRVSPKHNGSYVISLNYNSHVKHMRINISKDNQLYLSDNRYFKSIIELVSWYERNSLAESFHMLDARLSRPFKTYQ